MNITVYLGANEGNHPKFKNEIIKLGQYIARNGHRLIYGGSKTGLMGILAETVLEGNAEVIGVEPKFFIEAGLQQLDITQLIVTEDMSERKKKMIELGDVFIAFPGGTGTLEEISEVMSKVAIKHLNAPCIVFNLDGYYDSFKNLLKVMLDNGFSEESKQQNIFFADSIENIHEIIENFYA